MCMNSLYGKFTHGKAFMYSLSDVIYHVAKLFSHVTGGKVIEDFHLPEVGKPPISPVGVVVN